MAGFLALLRTNPNYRRLWLGQVVSEIGDHFNNIAVLSLVLQNTGSGLAVSGVMLSRAIPMLLAGPLAGVALDRIDRRQLMLASDLVRAGASLLFFLAIPPGRTWLVYLLSALLMGASPFFTSGRASILPAIASPKELHTANSLTQTTQWTTTAVGAFLGGVSATQFGFEIAFFLNMLSFLFSAWSVWLLRAPQGTFQARPKASDKATIHDEKGTQKQQPEEEQHEVRLHPWRDYAEGLAYIRRRPRVFAILMVSVGWASGGGAAQVLFTLFGERVFGRGSLGTGELWGAAGIGLVFGGVFAHWLYPRLSFAGYRRAIPICYLVHGGAYVLFSLMENYALALLFIGLSRAAVAVSSVMNFSQLLQGTEDAFRGRVFATNETLVWGVMMLSMTAAGFASDHLSIRWIGAISGILSSLTAVYWTWASMTGRLPEPEAVASGNSAMQEGQTRD